MRVLIVDRDPASRRYAAKALEESGIAFDAVDCPVKARGALVAAGSPYDVVLLDVERTAAKGWELLRQLRGDGVQVPIVFVTARESLRECVRGLDLGGDDFIVKPFEYSELVWRIRAVLRRSFGDFAARIDTPGGDGYRLQA